MTAEKCNTRERRKVRASLLGFWERQKQRAAMRKEKQAVYYKRYRESGHLPVAMIHRRPFDPIRDIYPWQTHEVHTEIARVPK